MPLIPGDLRKACRQNAGFRGGAESVLVYDGHGGGENVLWEELDERATLLAGQKGPGRFPLLPGHDGLILLGYHARAGTAAAVLEHTYSSARIQNLWLNGKPAGEFAVDAAIAGEMRVPVIMTSGDDKLCMEAREWLPGVVACEVKKGMHTMGAALVPKEEAHRPVAESACEAIGMIGRAPPLRIASPVTLRVEVTERTNLPRPREDLVHIDGRTYEITADSVEAANRQR